MKCKWIYISIFVVIGIIYSECGLLLDEFINNSLTGINFGSFFVPLILFDTVISVILYIVFKKTIGKHEELNIFELMGFWGSAVIISIVTVMICSMIRFMLGMDF